MTREEALTLGQQIKVPSMMQRSIRIKEFVTKIYDDFEQQIQKLQEENEHLKNMLQAHTKEK